MTKPSLLPSRPDEIDGLEIATPCQVPWDSLPGGARVRHCGKCKQNVYNIEAMSRGEALRLVAAREGQVCLRIFRRPDGTVVTAGCWSRLRAARARGVSAFLAVLVVAALAELAAMAVGILGLRRLTDSARTMGALESARIAPVAVPAALSPRAALSGADGGDRGAPFAPAGRSHVGPHPAKPRDRAAALRRPAR